ncbi:MarR family winged helix-turn-helix transcriptional regulator [Clostridium sp. JNZ X4-2]
MSKTNLNNLYRALHRLNRQMHRTAHGGIHSKGGFHHGQANLLTLILKNDGASQRILAEQLDVRPSSMTEMLSKMEQSGLITRKQGKDDQRVMHIYLTEEGRKAAKEIIENTNAFTESIFSALTEIEKEQMLAITEKLCTSLEAMDKSDEEMHQGHGEFLHDHHCHHRRQYCLHDEKQRHHYCNGHHSDYFI